jgi:hypothetical protein
MAIKITCHIRSFFLFMKIKSPVLEDFEPDYDPFWMLLVLQKDGCAIILKRTLEKVCIIITAAGCRLPLEYRHLTSH